MADVVLMRIEEGVLQVTLNRPLALNTLTQGFVRDFSDVLDRIEKDEEARVVILTGAGRAFCAGFDLNGYGDEKRLKAMGVPRGLFVRQAEIAEVVTRLQALSIPVIGAINGPCAGAGLSFAAACDIRIASTESVYCAAFLRAGVTPGDLGVSWLLPRIVGAGRAHELMYTGRRFLADEAEKIGFVSQVVPGDQLIPSAVAIAEQIKQNPPFQTALTKSSFAAALQSGSLQGVMELESRQQVLAAMTDDYHEAIGSYLGKRAPKYNNR